MSGRCLTIATLFAALIFFGVPVHAQEGQTNQTGQDRQTRAELDERADLTTDLQDPVVELQRIRQRRQITRARGDSLCRTSPLTPLREMFIV